MIKSKRYWILFLFCIVFLSSCSVDDRDNESLESGDAVVSTEGLVFEETIDITGLTIPELEVLAMEGSSTAAYRLGTIYDYGTNDIQQNFTKAFEWYAKARELGNAKGSNAIGYLYLNGCGVARDYNLAYEFFAEALNNQLVDAYVGLGRLSLKEDYEKYDPELALMFFDEGIKGGSLECKYFKSYMAEIGLGVNKNYMQARVGYKIVAQSQSDQIEDRFAINSANTRLGLIYAKGRGVKADYETAMEYFVKAAENGFSMASYYLGQLYEKGDADHEKDYDKALDCYMEAALDNYAPALNQVGYMYCNGLGVTIDYEKALYYQKLAAIQGYVPAQINIGYLYEKGMGTDKNLDIALSYYKLAAEAGYEGAEAAIVRVENEKNKG